MIFSMVGVLLLCFYALRLPCGPNNIQKGQGELAKKTQRSPLPQRTYYLSILSYRALNGQLNASDEPQQPEKKHQAFTGLSRLSKGCSLFSTSVLCRCISSSIMDLVDLQHCSSLKARVHLPSTRALDFNLAGSAKGKVDGRMHKCNHFGCFLSIVG